jgi:hypothetical protein
LNYRLLATKYNTNHRPSASSRLDFWKTYAFTLPVLFKMAKQLVCTPATSVPAECAFSISAYLGRKERARLSVKNLSTTMFLKVSFQNIYYVALIRFVTIIRSQ